MSTPEEISEMVADCEERSAKLSDWELKFVDDMSVRLGHGKSLTVDQDAKLEEIWNRVT